MNKITRRDCARQIAAAGVAALGWNAFGLESKVTAAPAASGMKFGFVTYLWGEKMDLPTLLDACEKSGMQGVELRTQHAHGVEPELSADARKEVRKRFADSPVTLVGYGSNCEFHSKDSAEVKKNIELAKQYIQLMHDCGGTGVKVKPNRLPEDVPHEQTVEQIGNALNEVAAYGEKYGQQIRVEVHGKKTSEIPVIKAIFDVADHPNATVCWNSNSADLRGEGLMHNFNLVKDRFGDTVHVRDLNSDNYPFQELMQMYLNIDYNGWILLEAHSSPPNRVKAMTEQVGIFERMTRQDGE